MPSIRSRPLAASHLDGVDDLVGVGDVAHGVAQQPPRAQIQHAAILWNRTVRIVRADLYERQHGHGRRDDGKMKPGLNAQKANYRAIYAFLGRP